MIFLSTIGPIKVHVGYPGVAQDGIPRRLSTNMRYNEMPIHSPTSGSPYISDIANLPRMSRISRMPLGLWCCTTPQRHSYYIHMQHMYATNTYEAYLCTTSKCNVSMQCIYRQHKYAGHILVVEVSTAYICSTCIHFIRMQRTYGVHSYATYVPWSLLHWIAPLDCPIGLLHMWRTFATSQP